MDSAESAYSYTVNAILIFFSSFLGFFFWFFYLFDFFFLRHISLPLTFCPYLEEWNDLLSSTYVPNICILIDNRGFIFVQISTQGFVAPTLNSLQPDEQ